MPWGCFSSSPAHLYIHTSMSYCDKTRAYLSLPDAVPCCLDLTNTGFLLSIKHCLFVSCVCVCVEVHVCDHVYCGTRVRVCGCTKSRVADIQCCPQLLAILYTLNLGHWLSTAAQWAVTSFCLPVIVIAGIAGTCQHVQLSTWLLSSGPHACAANTLPAEPSPPSPEPFFISIFQIHLEGQAWSCTLLIQALGRQGNICKFKASRIYIANSKPVRSKQ